MHTGRRFPADLRMLFSTEAIMLMVGVVVAFAFSAVGWLSELTPVAWSWWVRSSLAMALLGAAMLFVAKLPQYRAGAFFRFGSRHLPRRHQRLYWVALAVI